MGTLAGVVAYVHLTETAPNSKHTKSALERKLLELGAALSPRIAARVTHVVVVRLPPSKATATAAGATAEIWHLFQKTDKVIIDRPPPPPAVCTIERSNRKAIGCLTFGLKYDRRQHLDPG